MRSYDAALGWSGDRIGFAWDPNNSLGLSDARLQRADGGDRARLAAAIQASADPAAPGDGACGPPWCTASVDGAAFTPAWSTFSHLDADRPGLRLPAADRLAGAATGPMSVAPQIGGIVVPLPVDTSRRSRRARPADRSRARRRDPGRRRST